VSGLSEKNILMPAW